MKPTLLKLLISCNLLLAICALSMGIFAYRQQTFHNAQLALFQQLTHNLAETLDCPDWEQKAPFLAPEHPSQLEDLEGCLRTVLTHANLLSDDLESNRNLLTGLREVLAKTETEAEEAKAGLDRIQQEHADRQAQAETDQQSLARAQDDLEAAQASGRAAEEALGKQRATTSRLMDERDGLSIEVQRLKAELALLQTAKEEEPVGAGPVQVNVAAGEVLTIDPKWNSLVISRGSKDGLPLETKGFVHRDGRLIATITVTELKEDMAIAEVIDGMDIRTIQPGDRVFF